MAQIQTGDTLLGQSDSFTSVSVFWKVVVVRRHGNPCLMFPVVCVGVRRDRSLKHVELFREPELSLECMVWRGTLF